jgi:hypothetical protein
MFFDLKLFVLCGPDLIEDGEQNKQTAPTNMISPSRLGRTTGTSFSTFESRSKIGVACVRGSFHS